MIKIFLVPGLILLFASIHSAGPQPSISNPGKKATDTLPAQPAQKKKKDSLLNQKLEFKDTGLIKRKKDSFYRRRQFDSILKKSNH